MVESKTSWGREELWAELDALGETRVRELVLMDHFGSAGMVGTKRALAEEWIRRQEEGRREASQAENGA